jgi:tyrosyl-tRNA synthetase
MVEPNLDIKAQVEALTFGCSDVIEPAALEAHLIHSRKVERQLKIKFGADPTAPDLHLGHVVPLRKLRQFQDLGHIAIFLIGDFTGMIGDPSGRSKTRPPLSREDINTNAETYRQQVGKIVNLDPKVFQLRFNSEWSDKMSFADVIILASKYTVARMLERNDFSERLRDGRPVSLHELLYPLAQAYDSVALGCDVELGGQDQLFNFMVVRDIMQEFGLTPEVVMTVPLLVGTDGKHKMSKSLSNYIGVFEPADQIFGKVMSIPDEMLPDYYRLASGVAWQEVERVLGRIKDGTLHPREAKADLAQAVVALYYDVAEAKRSRAEFDRIFSEKELPADMPEAELRFPHEGLWVVDMIDVQLRCEVELPTELNSRSAIRRKLAAGAFKLEGEPITDAEARIKLSKPAVLQYGKRFFVRITPTG